MIADLLYGMCVSTLQAPPPPPPPPVLKSSTGLDPVLSNSDCLLSSRKTLKKQPFVVFVVIVGL
jgi:hypothetical protein